jgi:hypothetical protein
MLSVSHLTAVLAHVVQQHNSLLTFSLLEDISKGMCGESLLSTLIFVVSFV